MEKVGVYIHIPFCKRQCFYCHFTKFPYDEELVNRYVHALSGEIRLRSDPSFQVESIYVGGGSPSVLTKRQFAGVIDAIYESFPTIDDVEFTVEMNPDDVTKGKLQLYQSYNVNRISLGTQSFEDSDLQYLKRTHTAEQSREAVEQILDTGFTSLNIDYMISLPGQTVKHVERNISYLEKYPIPHVSVYLLEDVDTGEVTDVREERDHRLYFFARQRLIDLGFRHYEISNFSTPGSACRHNLKYWQNHPYIGAGVSAAGYMNGIDYKNTTDMEAYLDALKLHTLPPSEETEPDPELRAIVTGMRLIDGIPASCFDRHPEEVNFLLSNNMLIRRDGNISVSPAKLLLHNEILTHFMK